MTGEDKRAVIDSYIHAFNGFDVEGMMAALHPDAYYLVIHDGDVSCRAEGADELRSAFLQEGGRCSSRKKTVMEYYEKGEQVVLELSYSCVLAHEQPDGRVAGDTLTWEGIGEVTLSEDRIARLIEIFSASQILTKNRR